MPKFPKSSDFQALRKYLKFLEIREVDTQEGYSYWHPRAGYLVGKITPPGKFPLRAVMMDNWRCYYKSAEVDWRDPDALTEVLVHLVENPLLLLASEVEDESKFKEDVIPPLEFQNES